MTRDSQLSLTNMNPKENETAPAQPVAAAASGSAWVPITERLPKVGRRVLVSGRYAERKWIAIGAWQPAGSIDADYWEDVPEGWEADDSDTITNPEDLWVEFPVEIEQCGFLEGVTHWMPLPEKPNSQLSSPETQVSE